MGAEQQKTTKDEKIQLEAKSTEEAAVMPEANISGVLAAPTERLTPEQVETLQDMVGNQATTSYLGVSTVQRQMIQRQDGEAGAEELIVAIDALGLGDDWDNLLISVLNALQSKAGTGTIKLDFNGKSYTIPSNQVANVITAGCDHLTQLLVEAIDAIQAVGDLASLNQHLQRLGCDYHASAWYDGGFTSTGLTRITLPGGTLPLSKENTENISQAADNKIGPFLLEFARARMDRMNEISQIPLESGDENLAQYDIQRRESMEELHNFDQDWLNNLQPLANLRLNRWAHSNQAVQDAILAALQLNAVFNAEATLTLPDATVATAARSTTTLGIPNANWCGAFAMMNYEGRAPGDKFSPYDARKETALGMDLDLRDAFDETNNVRDFFAYRKPPSDARRTRQDIFDEGDDKWMDIQAYHDQDRHSLRLNREVSTVEDIVDFAPRSGDIVVTGGDKHIAMVHNWDSLTRTLFLIDGNAQGYRVRTQGNEAGSTEEAEESRAEAITGRNLVPPPNNGPNHVGIRVNDYGRNQLDLQVNFIGRPSIVDFEEHFYSPTAEGRNITGLNPRTGNPS